MAGKTNYTSHGVKYFRVTAKIGEKPDGTTIRKQFYGTGQKDAEAKRDAYLNNLRDGLDTDLSKLPVGKAMKMWLYEVKRRDSRIKDTSFERYEGVYRIYIEGTNFASTRVSDVRGILIQKHLNKLADDTRGYSQLFNTLKLIKMFFIYATKAGYTVKNPCLEDIAIPGGKPKKREVETFTDEEIALIRGSIDGHRLKLLVLLALGTGLRRGELLALKYDDIRGGKVYVSKTIANVAKIDGNGVITRSIEIGSPKSESSYRAVPVPKDMLAEIDAHKLRQMKERMAIGIGGKPEYIFATETGGLYDGSNVHKSFSRILEKAGVPHKKFHSLRHTYASQLVRMGVQLSVIQKLMGHSDIATTTIYVHVSDQDMIDAVEVLSAWLK